MKLSFTKTREQLDESSSNKDANWCHYYEFVEGVDRDMHGAHMIFSAGFENVHVSGVELFNVGQPRLARYPIHWHNANEVGARGGYADPSSAEQNSIYDSFRYKIIQLKPFIVFKPLYISQFC